MTTIMEKFSALEPAVLISLVALLFSFISPVISSIINGHYRIKEKKLDLQAEEKRRQHDFVDRRKADTIAKYLSSAGAFCKNDHVGNLDNFGSTMGEIYLHVDPSNWPLINQINDNIYIHSNRQKETSLLLSQLARALSAQSGDHNKNPDDPNK